MRAGSQLEPGMEVADALFGEVAFEMRGATPGKCSVDGSGDDAPAGLRWR